MPWLVLADGERDADLDAVVARLHQADQDRSSLRRRRPGRRLGAHPDPEPRPLPPLDPIAGPIWIIGGSQHEATRAQMEALAGTPECHVERFEALGTDFVQRLSSLPEHSTFGLALASASSPLITPAFAAWAAECISAIAAEARARGVGAFVATGGETAALLLRAIGAGALEIDRELLPGIPLCRILDGPWAGTPLATKAGGFGQTDALARAVAVLRAGGGCGCR